MRLTSAKSLVKLTFRILESLKEECLFLRRLAIKNMAKRRKSETFFPPQRVSRTQQTTEQPAQPVYQDEFQKETASKIEQFAQKFEGKGRTMLYGLVGLIALLIVGGLIYSWSSKQNGAAQAALGKAIETSNAQITDKPAPNSPNKTFATQKERDQKAVDEFQAVAEKYSSVADKAKYFAAVTKLSLDRPAALTEIEAISKSGGEVGEMAKFALAQANTADGKTDEAIGLYSDLANAATVVSKDTVNYNLAALYEKKGEKDKAVELYFNIAKAGREAKDGDGKAIPLSQTARDSADKVTKLAPDKAKELPEEKSSIDS